MGTFILNDEIIHTDTPPGLSMLDFIRNHQYLTGTKAGCREGDCGACTILVGTLTGQEITYKNMTSCLMPLANANGKHIVTVEGINQEELTPVQQALVSTSGTQCGFCTVGFVMSLTGFSLGDDKEYEKGIKSIDGNICRCTGYKSIERAVEIIAGKLHDKPFDQEKRIEWLVEYGWLPVYFSGIKRRLASLAHIDWSTTTHQISTMVIGGGTDLLVQRPLQVQKMTFTPLADEHHYKGIRQEQDECVIGGAVTVSELEESPLLNNIFPDLPKYIKLVSSSPIRNMATLGGNIVNASPIGDLTVFFLALDAVVELQKPKEQTIRKVFLKDLFLDYKQLDKTPEERILTLRFKIPTRALLFNFEKVSKRTHLDIATVNTACSFILDPYGKIQSCHLSAGGVGPIPMYLQQTVDVLLGQEPSVQLFRQALDVLQIEISPISDVRGQESYKRLLLRQLFIAHIQKIFPEIDIMPLLKNAN